MAYVGSIGTKLLTTAYPNFGTTFPELVPPYKPGEPDPSCNPISTPVLSAGRSASITNVQSNGNSNFHSLEVSICDGARHTAFRAR